MLHLPDQLTLTAEWREVQRTGTVLIARRRLTNVGTRLLLPIAQVGRVVRLFREGAAPASVVIPPGTVESEVVVPRPQTGGELFALFQAASIAPTHLDADGPLPARLEIDERTPSRRALPQGFYDLRIGFRSSVRSEPIAIEIRNGETTEITTEHFGAYGAADIQADEETASAGGLLSVYRQVLEPGPDVRSARIWADDEPSTRVRWQIDGLPVGSYEAVLMRDERMTGLAIFEVAAGATSQVTVQPPRVRLIGNVRIGSQAATSGTKLSFRLEGQTRTYETTTDAAGNYGVSLPQPGTYTASLVAATYLSTWTDDIVLVSGNNRFDWTVPGGVVRLELKREDGREFDELVQLQINGTRFHSAGPIMAAETREPLLLGGLPLSTPLTFKADTPSSLVAAPITIELTASSPSATVTLLLKQTTSVIELRDAKGVPLPGAHILAGNLVVKEDPPQSGLYKLIRTAPGTGVLITAAHHLPLCHVFQAANVPLTQLQMSPTGSAQMEIRLINVKATRPVGYFVGLPGSTCPVSLIDLHGQMRYEGNATVFTVALPPGAYEYAPFGRHPLRAFTVPGPPLEFVGPFK